MRFFSLPKIILFFASIFSRKNCDNHGFWPPKTLPKPTQNAFKNEVLKNKRFFVDFGANLLISQKCRCLLRPNRSGVLLTFNTNQPLAFCIRFGFEKPPKNPSKTRPEPFQNRCRKCIVFQHRFFRLWALILKGFWPPRWSQVAS